MNMNKTDNSKDNPSPNKVGDVLDSSGDVGDEKSLSGAPSKSVVEAIGSLRTVVESNKENEDPVAVVSPPGTKPVKKPLTPSMYNRLKKSYDGLKNKFKLQGKKMAQVLKSLKERDDEIDKLKNTIVRKDCTIASKETAINNLKNRIERLQERKTAIQDAALAGCTASIELYKAKFEAGKREIADFKKSMRRANRMLDSHEKQATAMKNRLNDSEARNSQLTEQVHTLKSDVRDLRKTVCSLKRQNEKLADNVSEKQLQREQVALERDRIKIKIAEELKMRAVLKEEAAESRQVNVEKTKAQLKDAAARKRKADKERDAHFKQAENNRKLKAARTMMMNCGDASSVASYHYDMNRSNPDNGMFSNSRQY